MKWCEEKSWYSHNIRDSSFISPAKIFRNNEYRGLEYIKKKIVPYLGGGETSVSNEFIYQQREAFEKLKGSKILVIGAGPSTLDMEYNPEDYDYVFSCNHFFRNEKVKKINMFAVFLGDEVDLSNETLNQYLSDNSETFVCFENIGSPASKVDFKKKYGDRVFWAHTRYHSKIGAMVRIVSFLCAFSPKSISFVGMDGPIVYAKREKHFHSFETAKERYGSTGTIESVTKSEEAKMNKYREQYLEFWDYVLHDVGSNISFFNLGHCHPCNITTQILTEKLGEQYVDYLSSPKKRNEHG